MKQVRVKVFSEDRTKFLGNGMLIGIATVYAVLMPDGSFVSFKTAEKKPSEEFVKKSGGKLMVLPQNPKIRLDDGTVVYGCQVWWTRKKARD